MFSLCVCVFLCLCTGRGLVVELITLPRSPTECVRSGKTEVNGEVHGGRPRPTGAVVPRKKNCVNEKPKSDGNHRRTVSPQNVQPGVPGYVIFWQIPLLLSDRGNSGTRCNK
jgi:hypothetical protein